uniref:FHA domain-containing protein n=1 Tax=viral metagenome TaxID=1070528 RepID=A0A6C0LXW8_9ZZZZ
MNKQVYIESQGHNETYINGRQVTKNTYHMEIPDGNEIKLDLNLNGDQYAIRDFTINDLEKMLHAPMTHRPTSFARSIIAESNKHIDIPKRSSNRHSHSYLRKSPRKSSRRSSRRSSRKSPKRSSKRSSRKLTRRSSHKSHRKSSNRSSNKLTIY